MIQPYLYKATHKDGRTITILGTMHCTLFTTLPQKLQSFLLSFDTLLSEGYKIEEEGDDIVKSKPFPGWFEDMPTRIQQDIEAVFSTEYDLETVSALLKWDKMIEVLGYYGSFGYLTGIDQVLMSSYSESSSKEILPLETEEDCDETFSKEYDFIENILSQDDAIEFLAEDHYNANIVNGGTAMSNFGMVIEYLTHNIQNEYDPIVEKRNKLWIEKLISYMKIPALGDILLAGGVAHILDKGGGIRILTKTGI
jgi:uncharacterized protein YbaP (TraB family)